MTRSITTNGIDGNPLAFAVDGHNTAASLKVRNFYVKFIFDY